MRSVGPRIGRLALTFAVLGTIGCDRVTKHVASVALAGQPGRTFLGDTVWVGYVENTGGFLSLGASMSPWARAAVFTVATGLMLVGLIAFAIRRGWTGWPALGLALFVAGGASNWIDRASHGAVVDFVSIGIGPLRTGVFNVADVAILLGAGVFALGFSGDPSRSDGGAGDVHGQGTSTGRQD